MAFWYLGLRAKKDALSVHAMIFSLLFRYIMNAILVVLRLVPACNQAARHSISMSNHDIVSGYGPLCLLTVSVSVTQFISQALWVLTLSSVRPGRPGNTASLSHSCLAEYLGGQFI